ncbi:putative leucine-rich repeat-containing protein, partial [Escherichia coli P0304799.3]
YWNFIPHNKTEQKLKFFKCFWEEQLPYYAAHVI